jgi:hypothetical protein
MQSIITLDDVLVSYAKYTNIFEIDYKHVKDLIKINPKSKYDTAYIPLLFKHINGKLVKAKFELCEQLISSNAKKPQTGGCDDDKDIPKCMNISINKLDRENIASGDYAPKKMDNKEDQDKENKRSSDNIDKYMKNNELFLKVLNIIDDSYKYSCEELKKQESKLDFKLKKDRKQTDIVINSTKQSSHIDKETNKDIELDNPIYRIKIPVCKVENYIGRIGIWSYYSNEFKETVFDARKMTKKNNYQAVPAKIETIINEETKKKLKKEGVKVYNKLIDNVNQCYILENLDFNNANKFITFKSLVGGTLNVECIISSKFGLSLSINFFDLYVFKHKTKEVQNNAKEIAMKMRNGMQEEEEEEDKEEKCDKENDTEDEDDHNDEPPVDSDDNENKSE